LKKIQLNDEKFEAYIYLQKLPSQKVMKYYIRNNYKMTSCNKQMIKSYASGSKQLCNIQMQKMSQFFFAIKILKINIKNESIKVGYFLNVCN
jgi:hypothetical protein